MSERYFTYRLVETKGAPSLEIDGILMHRMKDTTPDKDAKDKVKAIGVRFGRVLDTCMGLGYSAIEASKRADFIVTVEIDFNVVEIAKKNPWSKPLFENENINIIIGDVSELIKGFPDGYFRFIIHDPPHIKRAGELYGLKFYKELYRVLKFNGKMFHYTGSPGKRYRGKDYSKGIQKRLNEAGFITRFNEKLQGFICIKR